MAYSYRTVANSSSDLGIRVSFDNGKRFEEFKNSDRYWYYASEIVLGDSYHDWEMKLPILGDLSIYRKIWDQDDDGKLIASFPKGSWEFVRLIESIED